MTELLIIGAGISGLALALGCARRGVEVRVCERSPVMQAVGAGLTVSASARAGLEYLGLGDAIGRLAEPPDPAILLDWATGAPLTTRASAPHLWEVRRMARADLQAILLEALQATGKAKLDLGRDLVAVEELGDGILAHFADGTAIAAPMLIGADGARSSVRHALFEDGSPAYGGHIAWRFILPREAADPFMQGYGATITAGPRSSLTSYTMGQGALVNCVAITRSDEWTSEGWSEPGDPALLASFFADAHADARALIAMSGAAGLFRWGLFDRPVAPSWSKGHAALIGDAAHPVLPFLAFGAGLAVEDAVVMDRALAGFAPLAAFAAFEAARIPRALAIHAASRAQALAFAATNEWAAAAPPPFLDPGIHAYDPVGAALG